MSHKYVFSITAPTPRMRDRCLTKALMSGAYDDTVEVKNFFEYCNGELIEIFFNMKTIFEHERLWDMVMRRYNEVIHELKNTGEKKINFLIPSPFELGIYFSGTSIYSHSKKPLMQTRESKFHLDACFYMASRMDYNKFFESVTFDPPLLLNRFIKYFTQFRHLLYDTDLKENTFGFPLIKLHTSDKWSELQTRLNTTLKRKF